MADELRPSSPDMDFVALPKIEVSHFFSQQVVMQIFQASSCRNHQRHQDNSCPLLLPTHPVRSFLAYWYKVECSHFFTVTCPSYWKHQPRVSSRDLGPEEGERGN